MKNLRVSAKLFFCFTIVIVAAIVVGGIGLYGMSTMNRADDALYNENVIALSAMGNIREILQNQLVQMRTIALNADNKVKIQEIQNTLDVLEKEMDKQFAVYEGTITDISAEDAYFEAKNLYQNDFFQIKSRVKEASFISPEAAYEVMFDPQVALIRNTMVSDFDKSMENNDQWAHDAVNENTELFKTLLVTEIILLVLAVIVALYLAFRISSLISRPLVLLSSFMKKAGGTGDITLRPEDIESIGKYSQIKDEIGQAINGSASFVKHVTNVAKELESIADGDLSFEIDLLSGSDTMGLSLRKTVESLNSMFADINVSTNQVSTGAKQVADGAQSLAQGATEQAASIEELSSSIAEIADRIKDNTATAENASKLSETIKDNAMQSSLQMDKMISAVSEINEASRNISNIINTIDDIAFQTNILALNAAIEAARAGQHGKGFAVVAEEVRNLAFKSAEAAKDIGNMIQDTIEKAEFGNSIAGETAASLAEIVSAISESNRLIAEIARASEEQSMEISQIDIGINQVAQVVQNNSATAEESAAASEEMSGQSEMLHQLMTQFKLKENDASVFRAFASEEKPKQLRIAHRWMI